MALVLVTTANASDAEPDLMAALLRSPDVGHVEPNCIVTLDEPSLGLTSTLDSSDLQVTLVPWGIDRIDARVGIDGTYAAGASRGAGTDIYIVDTGVRIGHREFGSRATAGWSSGSDWPWVAGGVVDSSASCNSHGTHCASTAAGATLGVAPEATIIPVQVLHCEGSGTLSDIIAGIEWVIEQAALRGRPSVLSMSVGGERSLQLNEVIARAHRANIVAVVAAGNSNSDACDVSPASAAEALTVGSTTNTDARSGFSNYGPCIDLWAPGSAISGGVRLD